MLDVTETPQDLQQVELPAVAKPNYHTPEGELFRAAFALISDEDHWIQCRLNNGSGRFCTLGALGLKAAERDLPGCTDHQMRVVKALEQSLPTTEYPRLFYHPVAVYNDTHPHHEVMSLWRATGLREGWL